MGKGCTKVDWDSEAKIFSPIFFVISLASFFLFHHEQAPQIQHSILKTIPAIAPVVSKPFAVMSNPATEKRVLSYQTPD